MDLDIEVERSEVIEWLKGLKDESIIQILMELKKEYEDKENEPGDEK
ncbi:MAG: hypothetical protein HY015_03455 [Bacteroidetes bacterium]|nr:hypothetical protein [Bacteroidota bacterium]MBI3482021.1 hypothetical protein [Bacteroidota bacterium]